MLAHRDWGVTRIAESVRRSPAQVRGALDRLAALALLRPSLDAPGQLRPVDPELGLQELLHRQQARVVEQQHRLARSQAAVSAIVSEYAAARRAGVTMGSELLEGMDAVQSRLEELAHRATSGCLSLIPGGGQPAPGPGASKPLDELLLRRGVTVLTVYMDSMRNDAATLAYARWLSDCGGVVRTAPALPLRMVLFDREVALVPIDPGDARRGAVQVAGLGVITALVTLFEHVWEAAIPLHDRQQENGELTGQERELLRLLSQGLTDEVAARRLGVSLRTTRRMMASMMKRLGAHSRFEAGLRAKERCWLSP